MEIVLQWLDELDDLVFAGFAIWQRLRRLCLTVALATAIALHTLPRFGLLAEGAFLLLGISMASLAAWALVGVVTAHAERSGLRTSAVNA